LLSWFVARRSIQLSYGRIPFLAAFQQLTAGSAVSSTATFGHSKNAEKSPGSEDPGYRTNVTE
jgi:hypothetical protein